MRRDLHLLRSKLDNALRGMIRRFLGPPLEAAAHAYYTACRGRLDSISESTLQEIDNNIGPIDIVYTWVNDADLNWQQQKAKFQQQLIKTGDMRIAAAHSTRFHQRDELRYSLRSVERFAPFVRMIFIVTNGQVPEWLDTSNPKINLVSHAQIFSDPSVLPTFNSHAIESQLHHIDDLSERYLYLNDDFFLSASVGVQDFFLNDGKVLAYRDTATVPSTPVDPARDSTLEWGAKNNFQLLKVVGQKEALHKLLHVPYGQLKSMLFELEDRFGSAFQRVSANRFRHSTDISVATSLQQYYGALTGRVKLSSPSDTAFPACYVNVASPFLRPILKRIKLSGRYKAFCINEPVSTDVDTSEFDAFIKAFLNSMFPEKSAFEK